MTNIQIKQPRIEFYDLGPHSGFTVMAKDAQGREYILSDGEGFPRVMSYCIADGLVSEIKARGYTINPDYWGVRTPYGTEAWLLDGMEERTIEDERFGFC